jgi:hypothetical protein
MAARTPLPKRLVVTDFAKEDKIYVVNKSQGDVNITVYNNGKSDLIQVPRTWIPIAVTDYAPKKAFLDSSDFMKICNRGLLVLMKPAEAEAILNSEEAMRELNRVRNQYTDLDLGSDTPITPVEVLNDMDQLNIQPIVKDTLIREDITDEDKIALLVNHNMSSDDDTKLVAADYEHIITNSNKDSEISKWAAKELKKQSGIFKG